MDLGGWIELGLLILAVVFVALRAADNEYAAGEEEPWTGWDGIEPELIVPARAQKLIAPLVRVDGHYEYPAD